MVITLAEYDIQSVVFLHLHAVVNEEIVYSYRMDTAEIVCSPKGTKNKFRDGASITVMTGIYCIRLGIIP